MRRPGGGFYLECFRRISVEHQMRHINIPGAERPNMKRTMSVVLTAATLAGGAIASQATAKMRLPTTSPGPTALAEGAKAPEMTTKQVTASPKPAPKTLKDPSLTCQQLVGRFFNKLSPGREKELLAFLADSFIIYRSDGSFATKADYGAKHPAYTPWGLRVNTAAFASPTISCRVHNWLGANPTHVVPALYTFAWIDGRWQITSFAKFANAPLSAVGK